MFDLHTLGAAGDVLRLRQALSRFGYSIPVDKDVADDALGAAVLTFLVRDVLPLAPKVPKAPAEVVAVLSLIKAFEVDVPDLVVPIVGAKKITLATALAKRSVITTALRLAAKVWPEAGSVAQKIDEYADRFLRVIERHAATLAQMVEIAASLRGASEAAPPTEAARTLDPRFLRLRADAKVLFPPGTIWTRDPKTGMALVAIPRSHGLGALAEERGTHVFVGQTPTPPQSAQYVDKDTFDRAIGRLTRTQKVLIGAAIGAGVLIVGGAAYLLVTRRRRT